MSNTTQSDQALSVGSAVKNFLAGLRAGTAAGSSAASSAGAEDKFFSDLMAASQKYANDLSQQKTTRDVGSREEVPSAATSTATETVNNSDEQDERHSAGSVRDDYRQEKVKVSSNRSEEEPTAKVVERDSEKEKATDTEANVECVAKEDRAVNPEEGIVQAVDMTPEQISKAAETILSMLSAEGASGQTDQIKEQEETIDGTDATLNREDMEKAMLLFLQGLQARQVEDKGSEVEAKGSRMIETDAKVDETAINGTIEEALTKQDALTGEKSIKTTSQNNQKNAFQEKDTSGNDVFAGATETAQVETASVSETSVQEPTQRSAVRRHDDFLQFIKDSQGIGTSAAQPSNSIVGNAAPAALSATKNPVVAETASNATTSDLTAVTAKTDLASSTPVLDGAHKTSPYSFASQLSAARATRGGSAGLPSAVEQVALFINRNAKNGQGDQLTLQLKPEELGRIDIKLCISADQQVQGTVIADSQATLDLLSKDSSALERALQNAGLQADSGCLQFSLRGDGQSGFFQRDSSSARSGGKTTLDDQDVSSLAELAVAQESYYVTPERVNLRV